MKNIYLLAISLLFFSIEMTATPMQTTNSKTEITTQKKPTLKERFIHKFLKKKLKKIQKQNDMRTNRLAIASLVLGIFSVLALLSVWLGWVPSLAAAIIGLLLTPLAGVIAVILGAIALNRMRLNPNQSERKTFAIIGLTLGAIGGAAILLMLATGILV